MALTVLALVAMLLAAGITYEQWSRWRVPRKFPPPGQMVDVGGRLLHLNCMGEGTPTVILEAGGGSPSAVWMTVQPAIAQMTRVCSYDRAGLGWSEDREGTRDAGHIVDELHGLLGAANVPPPYIMVGHSLGGPYILVFAHDYPGEVAGFVFVDSTDPDLRSRMPPDLLAEPVEPLTLPKLPSILAATGAMRILNRDSPAGWPPELVEIAKAFGPQNLRAAFTELLEIRGTLARASAAGPFENRPIVVLTAGRYRNNPDRSQERNRQMRELRLQLQAELAALSTNSDHRMVNDAAHFVQLDNPESVIRAVRDVLNSAQTGTPIRGGESS